MKERIFALKIWVADDPMDCVFPTCTDCKYLHALFRPNHGRTKNIPSLRAALIAYVPEFLHFVQVDGWQRCAFAKRGLAYSTNKCFIHCMLQGVDPHGKSPAVVLANERDVQACAARAFAPFHPSKEHSCCLLVRFVVHH